MQFGTDKTLCLYKNQIYNNVYKEAVSTTQTLTIDDKYLTLIELLTSNVQYRFETCAEFKSIYAISYSKEYRINSSAYSNIHPYKHPVIALIILSSNGRLCVYHLYQNGRYDVDEVEGDRMSYFLNSDWMPKRLRFSKSSRLYAQFDKLLSKQ